MSPARPLATGARGGAVLAFLALLAGPARADGLSDETRQRAEVAFVVGRPEDLDAILGTGTRPLDVELLAVRDLLWRPAREEAAWPADDGSLSARRIAWLRAAARARALGEAPPEGAYPTPAPGETDPYPRATALVLERLQREASGARGLPEASPAWRSGEPALRGFVDDFARRAWTGVDAAAQADPEAEALRARQRALRTRNVVVAVVSFGLAAAAFALAWRRASRRGRRAGGGGAPAA